MEQYQNISDDDKKDGNIYHNSLYKNGDILKPHNWHYENMKPLCDIIKDNLKENIRIVDYGAGTGGSAIEIIKVLKEKNIKNYKIYLIDPLISWFSKAYSLLKDNDNVEFILCRKKINNKYIFLNISECINDKVDIIICANTIHLLKEKNINNLIDECNNMLYTNGMLLLNSGDINENDNENLNSFSRNLFNRIITNNNYDVKKELILKIFPRNINIKTLNTIVSSKFTTNIFSKNIPITSNELINFFKTPRLNNFCINNDNIDILNENIITQYREQNKLTWNYIICKKSI